MVDPEIHHHHTEGFKVKILRVVTLASKSGRYGGPFDTSMSQARLLTQVPGLHVSVFAGHVKDDQPAAPENFRLATHRVHNLRMNDGYAGCISLGLAWNLAREIRSTDVVHISFARELIPFLACFFAFLLRKPIVIQPHGMLTSRMSLVHKISDVITRPIYSWARLVICLTEVEQQRLHRWYGRKHSADFIVLGNPMPFTDISPYSPSKNAKAVFIARLHERKRVMDFISACEFAQVQGWNETYEAVGPDQGDGILVESAAERLKNFSYGGSVPSELVAQKLKSAAVFVQPSFDEPWGNVLASALRLGIPVVITRSAALADEVDDHKLGIVVSDGAPEEIARAVHNIIAGSWRSEEQRKAAKEYARIRFDQRAIRDALIKSYKIVTDQ